MKTMKLPDALFGYWIVNWMQKKAIESGSMENFVNWYVQDLILKTPHSDTAMTFHEIIKCKNDMGSIYHKLMNTVFVRSST